MDRGTDEHAAPVATRDVVIEMEHVHCGYGAGDVLTDLCFAVRGGEL